MRPYTRILDRLLKVNMEGGVKLGLENCLRLNEALGNPIKTFASVHIAGTNGKGSVVTKIGTALQMAGLRVGLYTSPHISTFRERIKINGVMISEKEVCKHLNHIFFLKDSLQIPATFFELSTLLAFAHFAEENIDIAVVETGLGGRLDATNIITPKLSVITSISLDHTDILGDTLEKIALEKAGIIKPGIPVVIGPRVPRDIINEISSSQSSPCFAVDGKFLDFHAENEAVAKKALEVLHVPPKVILKGLNALPHCRLEMFFPWQLTSLNLPSPLPEALFLDVAHNPDGFHHLLQAIRRRYPHHPLRFVLGLSKNKNILGCLEIIKNQSTHFHLVEANNGRAASQKLLQEYLEKLDVTPDIISCESSVETAIHSALVQARARKELVVVAGTFFIMAAARKALGIEEPNDQEDMNER